jgi:hypothetical protein
MVPYKSFVGNRDKEICPQTTTIYADFKNQYA